MHAIACELKAWTDREIGGKRFKEREGTDRDIIHFNSGQEVAWRSGGQATPRVIWQRATTGLRLESMARWVWG